MKAPRAFTLVELLVVVGIIALISSVALAAFNLARLRSYDAAVKREAAELRTILAREMTDTGSYAAIKSGGAAKFYGTTSCPSGNFTGTYAAEAKRICDTLLAAARANNTCGPDVATSLCLRFNLPSGASNNNRFSIEAYLPYESAVAGAPRYLCMGSSGNTSIAAGISWNEPGCWQNP